MNRRWNGYLVKALNGLASRTARCADKNIATEATEQEVGFDLPTRNGSAIGGTMEHIMPQENLATYLNDHLAGSVMAVDVLAQLEQTHAGTEMARLFAELRADIEADRAELKTLMTRFEIPESRPRKAAAWISAKLSEIKLRLEDDASGPLRLLESVEAVALGIDGKLALWRSLAAAAEVAPKLREVNYDRLAARAKEQRWRAEEIRLTAAKAALAEPG